MRQGVLFPFNRIESRLRERKQVAGSHSRGAGESGLIQQEASQKLEDLARYLMSPQDVCQYSGGFDVLPPGEGGGGLGTRQGEGVKSGAEGVWPSGRSRVSSLQTSWDCAAGGYRNDSRSARPWELSAPHPRSSVCASGDRQPVWVVTEGREEVDTGLRCVSECSVTRLRETGGGTCRVPLCTSASEAKPPCACSVRTPCCGVCCPRLPRNDDFNDSFPHPGGVTAARPRSSQKHGLPDSGKRARTLPTWDHAVPALSSLSSNFCQFPCP